MDTIFALTYPKEFGRHPFIKRTYLRDKIVERTYSYENKSCWQILDENGCREYRSNFEPQPLNFHNICWFTIHDDFYCFSRDFKEIYLLDDNLDEKRTIKIENPLFGQFKYLYPGHTTIENEIPFLFGDFWTDKETKYFSVLKVDRENHSAKWLFKSDRDWLYTTYKVKITPNTEIDTIDQKDYVYPLRTYNRDCNIDDIIWDGNNFILKKYGNYQYFIQRPNYSLVQLDEEYKYTYPENVFQPKNYTDHLYLLNTNVILGTPNSFYDNSKTNPRKTNNQYVWDIDEKEFISIPLPKKYNKYYIHYIEFDNFMTISKFDKEKNETRVINLDIKTDATRTIRNTS